MMVVPPLASLSLLQIGLQGLLLLRREHGGDLALHLRFARSLALRVAQNRPNLRPLVRGQVQVRKRPQARARGTTLLLRRRERVVDSLHTKTHRWTISSSHVLHRRLFAPDAGPIGTKAGTGLAIAWHRKSLRDARSLHHDRCRRTRPLPLGRPEIRDAQRNHHAPHDHGHVDDDRRGAPGEGRRGAAALASQRTDHLHHAGRAALQARGSRRPRRHRAHRRGLGDPLAPTALRRGARRHDRHRHLLAAPRRLAQRNRRVLAGAAPRTGSRDTGCRLRGGTAPLVPSRRSRAGAGNDRRWPA